MSEANKKTISPIKLILSVTLSLTPLLVHICLQKDEEFGEERLLSIVNKNINKKSSDIIAEVFKEVKSFALDSPASMQKFLDSM